MWLSFIAFISLLPLLSTSQCVIDDDCGYNVYCENGYCETYFPEWTTYCIGVICIVFACISFACVHRYYGSWGRNALICYLVSLILLGGSVVEFGWCPYGLGWGVVLSILCLIFLLRGVHWSYLSSQPPSVGYQPVGRPWGPWGGPWGRPPPQGPYGAYPPQQYYYPQQQPYYYGSAPQQYAYYPQAQAQTQQSTQQNTSANQQQSGSTMSSNIQGYTTDGNETA